MVHRWRIFLVKFLNDETFLNVETFLNNETFLNDVLSKPIECMKKYPYEFKSRSPVSLS